MSSSFTPNYSLSQWEAEDLVKRIDFNADNAKIDAALKALNTGKAEAAALTALGQRVDGLSASKAEVAALTALGQRVDGLSTSKAEAAALTALSQRVDGLSTSKADAAALTELSQTVTKKGNCSVTFGNYIGKGTYGASKPITLGFDRTPVALFYLTSTRSSSGSHYAMAFRGMSQCPTGPQYSWNYYTWKDRSVSWYSTQDAEAQLNTQGQVYDFMALLV